MALLAAASQAQNAANDADLLDLYRGVIELQKMHNAFCPEFVLSLVPVPLWLTGCLRRTPLVVDFSAWFEPYVRRWLVTTDTKTAEWVKLAITHDKVRCLFPYLRARANRWIHAVRAGRSRQP